MDTVLYYKYARAIYIYISSPPRVRELTPGVYENASESCFAGGIAPVLPPVLLL